MLFFILSAALAADAAVEQAVTKVQATYQKAGDMTASFEQNYIDKLRGKKRSESGKLWVKADGRARWSYEKPERKDFVFDGKTAYFYEPESSQVTIFDRFLDSPLANAMRFLWGQGDLRKTFDLGACQGTCPPTAANEIAIRLTPKEGLPAVEHITLVVDAKSGVVRQSIVFDPLGNRTEYRFNDLSFNAKIDHVKFVFSVPPGVSILRAAADGAAAPPSAADKAIDTFAPHGAGHE